MNAFPGRRRFTPPVQVLEVKPEVKEEPKQEAPMSLVGLKACPKCGKEMSRGLAMHYRHCKA